MSPFVVGWLNHRSAPARGRLRSQTEVAASNTQWHVVKTEAEDQDKHQEVALGGMTNGAYGVAVASREPGAETISVQILKKTIQTEVQYPNLSSGN